MIGARQRAMAAVDALRHAFELARASLTPRGTIPASFSQRWMSDAAGGFAGDPRQWVQPGDRQEHVGDEDFGWGWLRKWTDSRVRCTIDAAPTAATDRVALATRIDRYDIHPVDSPQAMAHTIVEAADLVIDFSRLYPARTLKHRPLYRMGRGCPYHRYRAGALTGSCRWDDRFRVDALSQDHLRDIFDSFRTARSGAAVWDDEIAHPVLVVTREGDESANLFHATTDFLNAFQSILVCGGIDRLDLGVVLLDRAAAGPFDSVWRCLFAPGRGVMRVRDFGGRRVRFKRAIFSPAGYQSCFYAYLARANERPARVGMLEAFASLMLRAHGFDLPPAHTGARVRATLVSRRPYGERVFLNRQLANEAACLNALSRIDGVSVETVDFSQMAFEQQIRVVRETDLLIGAHGAALTHLLWSAPNAAILEIASADPPWHSYRNLAAWTGRAYARIAAEEYPVAGGTALAVEPGRLADTARALVARIGGATAGQ
jgi:hypothetical protein